jgi:hypothetical protein
MIRKNGLTSESTAYLGIGIRASRAIRETRPTVEYINAIARGALARSRS